VYLYKRTGTDESDDVTLSLNVTNLTHSHPMAPNALQYKQHEKLLEEYTKAVRVATFHRDSFLPYSVSQRILEKEGLSLSRSDYYNLHRDKAIRGVQDEFEALVHALDEAGFKYAYRMDLKQDENGKTIRRQLQQIWFALDQQIELAQRFIADFTLLADGTFSTNALNLNLITMIGITNTGHSFPAIQSFARSEAAMSFSFIFECNRDFIFTGTIPPPRVVISDQAGGIISSLPNYLSKTTLQFCDWHVQQNIKSRLLKGRYTKDLRELIISQFWRYCKAQTLIKITEQKVELTALLAQVDVEYILNTWRPKERQFLRFYTKTYANLGCNSNQRSESTHVIIKEILNPQLRLSEATARLNQTIRRKLRNLANEEIRSNKLPRALDRRAFIQLVDTVTTYALDIISTEWESTKEAVDQDKLSATVEHERCQCEILLRYGLPCRHYLQDIYRNGQPIPRSLIHPRWWINGPVIQYTDWRPTINTMTLPISPPRIR
jgi:MULE transposase domain